MAALTMGDLKNYVTGGKRNMASSTILLDISHNLLKRRFAEIQFDLDNTVEEVKERIYLHTGTLIDYQVVTLNNQILISGTKLRQYNPRAIGDTLQVVDTDPNSRALGGGLEDVSLVKKYVMTEEDYDKRKNTVRSYKRDMLAKDPNWVPPHLAKQREAKKAARFKAGVMDVKADKENYVKESLEEVQTRCKVGARVECAPGARRGEVVYVGYVPEIKSVEEKKIWVGVRFDEPVGKTDGKLGKTRYFQTAPKCAGFLHPVLVVVGDFPAVDPFDDLDSDEDEEDVMEEL